VAIALFVAMGRSKAKKDKLLANFVLQAKRVTLLRLAANSALPVNTQVSIATAA
jgi:alpha-D-ribose 1-methylphosphonate 5-triphosphate synthase subunit PhnI